jgi:hypothetical protein
MNFMTVLILETWAEVSETSLAQKRGKGGSVRFDHVTQFSHFPTLTSSSAKLLAQSFNPSLSLVNHLSVCSHTHPSVSGW